eukprot:4918917-Prymnesium_polylepis.1
MSGRAPTASRSPCSALGHRSSVTPPREVRTAPAARENWSRARSTSVRAADVERRPASRPCV